MQSPSSPYVPLVAAGTTPSEAARLLGCDARTAKRCLAEARRILRESEDAIETAVSLLRHAGVRPEDMPRDTRGKNMSRRSWDSVALGLRKAA